METIAIVNQKGGTGKTTLAVNLTAELARRGKRVVLMDLDPQAGASAWLGFREEETDRDQGTELKDCIIHGKPVLGELFQATGQGFYVVPSGFRFEFFEVEAREKMALERLLKKAIETLPAAELDYIVMDCPPRIGPITTNALTAADWFIVPMETQAPNLEPSARVFELAREVKAELNPKLECLGLVPSRYRQRLRQDQDVLGLLRAKLGKAVLETAIRDTTRIGEAYSNRIPIQAYEESGHGSEDFSAVADELLGKMEKVEGVTSHG